jgi:hypothetical protein
MADEEREATALAPGRCSPTTRPFAAETVNDGGEGAPPCALLAAGREDGERRPAQLGIGEALEHGIEGNPRVLE